MKKNLDIAIIGMSGVFPGAETISEYWNNLKEGKISITEIPEERWEQSKFATNDVKEKFKIYCNTGGFIADSKRFDYEYFNMSKEEAIILDPQQRVMLQLTKKLFNQAGYSKKDYYGKNIAVYMGVSQSASNELHGMYTRFFQLDKELQMKMFEKFGNPSWHSNYLPDSITNLIAGRISHEFNLTGPSMVIDTACSSSLVALHHACQILRLEESDMAIAGGIYLHNTPSAIMGFCAAGALSHSGNLRAFDERADGFVPGEAAGIVFLKRLEDAQRDHDYIHAIIRGSVINNDGHTLGVMAPNPNRQRSVITKFYNNSEISPNEIQYMEAHGTGTKIGDLSEFNSLSQVFGDWDVQKQSVALGSVKSNIGHSISASGIASIIKILGMMKEKTIYKQANYEKPNRKLQMEHSAFYIPTENQKLHKFKYAAINSFGFGGTNAHVVLEKFRNVERTKLEFPQLICFSAYSESMLQNFAEHIKEQVKKESTNIGGIIRKVNQNTKQFAYKVSFIATSIDDLCEKLDKIVTGKKASGIYRGCVRKTDSCISVDGTKNDSAYLEKLANLYVKGNKLDFQKLYAGFHTSTNLVFYSKKEYKVNPKNFYEKRNTQMKKIDFCQIISLKEAEELLGKVHN